MKIIFKSSQNVQMYLKFCNLHVSGKNTKKLIQVNYYYPTIFNSVPASKPGHFDLSPTLRMFFSIFINFILPQNSNAPFTYALQIKHFKETIHLFPPPDYSENPDSDIKGLDSVR